MGITFSKVFHHKGTQRYTKENHGDHVLQGFSQQSTTEDTKVHKGKTMGITFSKALRFHQYSVARL